LVLPPHFLRFFDNIIEGDMTIVTYKKFQIL